MLLSASQEIRDLKEKLASVGQGDPKKMAEREVFERERVAWRTKVLRRTWSIDPRTLEGFPICLFRSSPKGYFGHLWTPGFRPMGAAARSNSGPSGHAQWLPGRKGKCHDLSSAASGGVWEIGQGTWKISLLVHLKLIHPL